MWKLQQHFPMAEWTLPSSYRNMTFAYAMTQKKALLDVSPKPHHWSNSHLVVFYRKFFPPSRIKPNGREYSGNILPFDHSADILSAKHCILSQNHIFSAQTIWSSTKLATQSVQCSLRQGSPWQRDTHFEVSGLLICPLIYFLCDCIPLQWRFLHPLWL